MVNVAKEVVTIDEPIKSFAILTLFLKICFRSSTRLEQPMKFVKFVALISFVALFAMACGNTTTDNTPPKPSPGASPMAKATPTPDEMAATREYFADNCASCHMENGEGGIVKIEGKKLNVPPLTKGHALKHSDEEFTKQIAKGGDGMPAFKDKRKPEEIQDLINYIRKTFQNGAPPEKAMETKPDSLSATPGETKK
jgi:mono/diheme cytochrome c family protein